MTPLTTKELKALRAEAVPDSGNRIAAACRIADAKQMDIARATGLSPQKVSDIVNGRSMNLKIGTARKFAKFFGCHIEDLFPASDEAVAS